MKVLLTGAGGFVGAHVLNHILATTDWHVTATDDYDTGPFRGRRARVEQVLSADPSWERRVLVVPRDLSVTVTSPRVDWIINLASESHVDRSIAEPRPFVENNVALMLSVLECARAMGASVLHVSTDEVYGPIDYDTSDVAVDHDEWAPLRPSNPYSASKAAQESLLHGWWRTYGLNVGLVNCVNMIGEMQHPEKYLPRAMRAILNGKTIDVHRGPDGFGSRYYLHARNCADAICWLIERKLGSQWSHGATLARWNIASEDRIDNLALAEATAAILDRPLYWMPVDGNESRPGHDLHYGIDGSKLKDAGWKPPVLFDEALERTVRWTMDHPQWLDG